jgi:hypothetical protein
MSPERTRRDLRVEAEKLVIKGGVFSLLVKRDFELLIEVANIIQNDAPRSLARHDPLRYKKLRDGITDLVMKGLGNMTEEGIRRGLRRHGLPEPKIRMSFAQLASERRSSVSEDHAGEGPSIS